MESKLENFESQFSSSCRVFKIQTYLPQEDVAKTLAAITKIVPLRVGCYENVAFQSQPGIQKFRPIAGSHLGETQAVLDLPVVALVFTIPHDKSILENVIDTIFEEHVAEEPVIYIDEVYSTRAKSYSQKSNPNRFWNRAEYKDQKDW